MGFGGAGWRSGERAQDLTGWLPKLPRKLPVKEPPLEASRLYDERPWNETRGKSAANHHFVTAGQSRETRNYFGAACDRLVSQLPGCANQYMQIAEIMKVTDCGIRLVPLRHDVATGSRSSRGFGQETFCLPSGVVTIWMRRMAMVAAHVPSGTSAT